MTIFDVLTMIGGLCLFLFGMSVMGDGLERRAGNSLKTLLGKLTDSKIKGFLTGLGVTAVIQSSSATTVMVVGFVNSRLMTLKQSIGVIMGANIGTTVTAWILSLGGISSDNLFMQLLKPTSFTPVLALLGTVFLMFSKQTKQKDVGTILLGFATLMFGMDTMSASVAGLKEVEGFRNILTMFSNPILGVLAGAILTAIIQSSSASVGILQALSSTGQVNFGAAIPIIMGQNIGTCVTALLSSVGTNRNARRSSIVHLSFNIIGTVVLLTVFCLAQAIFDLSGFVNGPASEMGIAIAHSAFNILCTAMLLPASSLLEKLSYRFIPEPKGQKKKEEKIELDERLMATPAIALERCRVVTNHMASLSAGAMEDAMHMLEAYDPETADGIKTAENAADRYEDILGSYLVKLSTYPLSDKDSHESAKLLHVIGDFERISDHAVNILESAEELMEKGMAFSETAQKELKAMVGAVNESVVLAKKAFEENDLMAAMLVEPLEEIVDALKKKLRSNHIMRMQKGDCTIEMGVVWSDLLTNLERISDHCSNIAGCVIEMSHDALDLHDYLRRVKKESRSYQEAYREYQAKYLDILA